MPVSVDELSGLKRLESERGLAVQEATRDQVRRALEGAGIMFMESDQGRGVMLLTSVAGLPYSKNSRAGT